MKNKKGLLALVLALTLVVGAGVGGTVAWLVASSNEVVNTFTYGDINLELYETAQGDGTGKVVTCRNDLQFIPGENLAKDPTVKVKANSESCWLFVKVQKSTDWPRQATYAFDAGWSQLTGTQETVYYREVPSTEKDTEFQVLKGSLANPKGEIVVPGSMTKADIGKTNPTLTFKAYAVQKSAADSAADAWKLTM